MKRALLVGLDEYTGFSPLGGCVNDVHALEPLLARNDDGSVNFNCQVRTSPFDISRDGLLGDVERLLGPGADVALLYFAGHGAAAGSDVVLCTHDGTSTTPGVGLSQVLGSVRESPVREVIVVLDCCFSGAAGGVPQLGADLTVLRDGVTILAASRGDQTSAEASGRASSRPICAGPSKVAPPTSWAGSPLPVCTHTSTSRSVLGTSAQCSAPAWTGFTNFAAVHPPLRSSTSNGSRSCSRRLTTRCSSTFRTSPEAEPSHPEHEETFGVLQACRAAKLVEPVDADHMYFAAMQSKACRLTPLGRHYRAMAEQGLL